jgi:hypothetical protein
MYTLTLYAFWFWVGNFHFSQTQVFEDWQTAQVWKREDKGETAYGGRGDRK